MKALLGQPVGRGKHHKIAKLLRGSQVATRVRSQVATRVRIVVSDHYLLQSNPAYFISVKPGLISYLLKFGPAMGLMLLQRVCGLKPLLALRVV